MSLLNVTPASRSAAVAGSGASAVPMNMNPAARQATDILDPRTVFIMAIDLPVHAPAEEHAACKCCRAYQPRPVGARRAAGSGPVHRSSGWHIWAEVGAFSSETHCVEVACKGGAVLDGDRLAVYSSICCDS